MGEPPWDGPIVGRLYRPRGGAVRGGAAPRRSPRVLVALHAGCPVCGEWVRDELERVAPALGEWGGRIETAPPAGDERNPAAWVAVVDEWDRVFHVARVGPGHAFPDPTDLVDWIRFVAIQCEECEGPEGPWRL